MERLDDWYECAVTALTAVVVGIQGDCRCAEVHARASLDIDPGAGQATGTEAPWLDPLDADK